jgi:hypothetical protein
MTSYCSQRRKGLADGATTDAIIRRWMPLVDGLGFCGVCAHATSAPLRPPSLRAITSSTIRSPTSFRNSALNCGSPLWLEDLVGLARNLLKVTH